MARRKAIKEKDDEHYTGTTSTATAKIPSLSELEQDLPDYALLQIGGFIPDDLSSYAYFGKSKRTGTIELFGCDNYLVIYFYHDKFTNRDILIEMDSKFEVMALNGIDFYACSTENKYSLMSWSKRDRTKGGGDIHYNLLADNNFKLGKLFGIDQTYDEETDKYFYIPTLVILHKNILLDIIPISDDVHTDGIISIVSSHINRTLDFDIQPQSEDISDEAHSSQDENTESPDKEVVEEKDNIIETTDEPVDVTQLVDTSIDPKIEETPYFVNDGFPEIVVD
eukprot:TRINITY_DN5441_c0_g2_i1.p1 TRINITY_DN5441_c0_g2~~TRINITY_DN5441_c0_g2_i1.p1  ORF type:complete len:319 (+),score=78.30 TRINITY_DN5441_c0_g2_i1:115-957(+)